MPTTIRKAFIGEFGDVSKIRVISSEIADPAADEVQVKVIYSGFSGTDTNMRLGKYPFQRKAPLTPGYCLVGRVHANGPACSKFKKGDMVVAVTVYDAQAQLCNVVEKYLHRVPAGMDAEQACGLVMDWNTAYGMVMNTAKDVAGKRVFIHGMSGAVGYATMMLCKLQGAEVFGTASTCNHEEIKKLGAHPFVYKNKDWMTEIKKLGGADVVFDPLGFESWDESYSVLNTSGGLLVGYGGNKGSLNGETPRSVVGPTAKLFARNLNFCSGKRTKFYYITRDDDTFGPDLHSLFKLHSEGKIRVPIKHVWDLEDVQDAHRGWTSTPGVGSLFIRVSDESDTQKN